MSCDELAEGKSAMKKMTIAVSFLLVAGLLTGCNRAKDRVLPDGTKIFGERTLKDGTRTAERVEQATGEKDFNVAFLQDGSKKVGRVEYSDGEKQFDVTRFADGSTRAGRVECSDGRKIFNETWLRDGTVRAERIELPDGDKQFDVILVAAQPPDGTMKLAVVPPAAKAAIADGVGFLNQHFVISDNSLGRLEPTGFRADESHLIFEFDYFDSGKLETHHVESGSGTDLDPESVRDLAGFVFVDCKNQKTCVSESESGANAEFNIGPVADAYVEEAKQYIRQILLLQQGRQAPEVTHAPTEEEIARFLRASVPDSAELGAVRTFNRAVFILGDDLVEEQDGIEPRTGERGHLTMKIRLSEADIAVNSGTDVGIVCDLIPGGTALADCVHDNIGDHSTNIAIKGIPNAPLVAKMLNRLILLHKNQKAAPSITGAVAPVHD